MPIAKWKLTILFDTANSGLMLPHPLTEIDEDFVMDPNINA